MITFDSLRGCAAVAHTAVKIFCTCKNVYHCLVVVLDVGEGGMVGCIEKGILDSEFVGEIKV